jgi:hypothetical protein
VVALADYSVKLDGDTYRLVEIPGPKSKIVETEKKAILDDINLTELNNGLKRCGGLLYLAFNGVAGQGELRRDINKLQDDLVVQSGKTSLALGKFSRATAEVLDTVKDVFTYLAEGTEDVAIELLKQTGGVADGMAKEALELAQGYEKLANDTMSASGKTQIAQSKTDQEVEELKAQQADLKAKTARAKSLSDSLAESRKKLEQLYTEAKEKADQASERGFAVQMVGAILGPIAQGLGSIGGAFVAARTGGLAGGTGATVPPSPPKVDSAEEEAAKKKLEDEKKKKETAEKDVADAEAAKKKVDEAKTTATEIATKKETDAALAKEKADKKPDDAALKTAAETAKIEADKAKADKEAAEKALKEANDVVEAKKKTLAAIGESIKSAQLALETAAKNLQATGAGLLDLAKSYEEEKRNYLKLILDYEKQGIEALADIAEYAVRMSAVTNYESVKRMASDSLLQAIKALNTVAQILRDAAKFWMSMKYACDALVAPKFLKTIEVFSKLPVEKRTAEWKKEGFKTNGVMLMAKWQALHVILVETSQSVSETRKEVQSNIVSSPSPEESLKLVPDLAKALSISVTRAKDTAQDKLNVLEKAERETPKAA